jgi:predicted transcriptional regulator of viral defense system
MVFQVVTRVQLPPIQCAAVRVEFVVRSNLDQVPMVERNTPRGVLRISSPEATAFDLVGYACRAGGLSNVATVLADLAEVLDAAKLADVAALSPSSWGRRLGWLLDQVAPAGLTDSLREAVRPFKETVPLNPRRPRDNASLDERWRILVNDEVEAET